MGFWIFMFICNIIIPIIMMVFGRVMWKNPPKKINGTYGYRTAMSMKNMDTWLFAHEYCGSLWWRIGRGLLIPSVIIPLLFLNSSEDMISMLGLLCLLQCVVLVASIIPVEKTLKRTFDENGNRR